jgi:superkiller protein 3
MLKRSLIFGFFVVILFCLINTVIAQDLQQQYNAKLQQANEVRAKMSQEGITREEYDKLKIEYDGLQTELKSLGDKINSDVALTEKINNAKRAYNDGNTLYKKGQFDEALVAYDKAISLDPGYSKAYYGKGLTFDKQRKLEEAIAAFKKAVEIDPSYDKAFSALGSIYKDNKNYTESINAYQKAIEIDQTDPGTVYNLALVYNDMKDYTNAIKYFRMATQLDPKYYKAYTLMGETQMNTGDLEQAVLALENALAIKDDYDRANFQLATVNNKLGNYAEALAAADKCLLKPGSYKGGANYEAGVACKQMGNIAKAKEYFEAAAKDSRWRKNAQYEIDLLNKSQGQ